MPMKAGNSHDGRSVGARRPLALALCCVAVTSCGPSHGGGDAASGTDASASSHLVTIGDLAAAGLPVFADPTQPEPMVAVESSMGPTPLRLLKDQADAMSQEAAAGQGTLGSDLDNLLVTADGLPPPSYLLAGYVSAAGTPGAALARRVMGNQDWVHAPSVTYPSLVLTLFAADAARYANALSGSQTTTSQVAGIVDFPHLVLRRSELHRFDHQRVLRCARSPAIATDSQKRQRVRRFVPRRDPSRFRSRHRRREWFDRCRPLRRD